MKIYRIAQGIKGLDISKDTGLAKKEYRGQQRELATYTKSIPGKVEKIVRGGKIIYEEIMAQIPGRNTGTVLKQRRRAWMKRFEEIDGFKDFCSHIADEDSERKVARIICDVVSGQMLLKDGKKRLINWATKYFKETATESKKSDSLEGSGYSEALLQFIKPELYFELGPNRELLAIKESFGREQKTWEVMSRKIAYIAKHLDSHIIPEIKRDLVSSDERTRLLALMMAITIETGLRPGAVGNAAMVRNEVTGEKKLIDTFGVSTLQVEHVKNIRDGFAELEFPGKKGGIQISQLTDAQIVSALRQVYDEVSQGGSSSMLFVTKSGEPVGDGDMRSYIKERWKDITPTDFRKFVASRSFYDNLKSATEEYRMRLLDSIAEGKEVLQESIIDNVVQIMTQAIESTKHVLNHKEGHDAWKSYISPKVILAYLSSGGLDNATLEEILIDNKSVRFHFDSKEFLRFAEGLT